MSYTRFIPLSRKKREAETTEETVAGSYELVASTEAPVKQWDWSEVLAHDAADIDWSACRSLLLNHDPAKIIGKTSAFRIDSAQLIVDATVNEKATLETGINVIEAIEADELRGVSIRYDYDLDDESTYDFNEETRTLTVRKWRLLEVSLTPIPADPRGAVRSLPDAIGARNTATTPRKEIQMPQDNDELAVLRAKNAQLETENKIRALAQSHSLSVDGIDLTNYDTAVAQLMERAAKPATPAAAVTPVTVVADASDKLRAAAAVTIAAISRTEADSDDAAYAKKHGIRAASSLRSIISKYAEADGVEDHPIAHAQWMARTIDLSTFGRRNAANITTSSLSVLLSGAANKALNAGLSSNKADTWRQWATRRDVANFQTVSNAGLSLGSLIDTPENVAFPELGQRDGGYSSTLGLFGATVSWSFQAIVNDQLGQYFDLFRRIGNTAAGTVEREAFRALLNATWTNDSTSSAGLGTQGNLDKTRAALVSKKSPAGEALNLPAAFLLHSPLNTQKAQQDLGVIIAGGQTYAASTAQRAITPLESAYVDDVSLKAGVASTDYYLTVDPIAGDTVLLNFLAGVGDQPLIMPYDAGATAGERYKIVLPFAATIATHVDSTGTTRVSGIQQGKA